MNHPRLYQRRAPLRALLFTTLLAVAPAWAIDDDQAAGAKAAGLAAQANELEAHAEKECLKITPRSRPLCREQIARAVARLRDRAQRAR